MGFGYRKCCGSEESGKARRCVMMKWPSRIQDAVLLAVIHARPAMRLSSQKDPSISPQGGVQCRKDDCR